MRILELILYEANRQEQIKESNVSKNIHYVKEDYLLKISEFL